MDLKEVMAGTTPKVAPQNLINPARISETGRPAGFYRSAVLDLLSVGSALFLGYAYLRYLTSGFSLWYVVAAIFLFATLSVLQAFLAQKIARRVLIIFGEALALVIFFLGYDEWQIVAVAGILALVFLLWGYFRSGSEAKRNLEVSFFGVSRQAIGKLVTAVLLAMVVLYAPRAEGQGIFVPQPTFKTFFDWASGSLNNFYPGVPFGGSFNNFSENFARLELQNNPDFRNVSPVAQRNAIVQAADRLAAGVTQITGVAPAPDETVNNVAYRTIIAVLTSLKGKLQGQFIVAWAALLFLVLRALGIVFVWIAQFVALLFYEILLASGFMHITEVTHTKESVEY